MAGSWPPLGARGRRDDGRPEAGDVCVDEARVVRVVQRRAVAQERFAHPLGDAVGGHDATDPVRIIEEQTGRRWPLQFNCRSPIMPAVHLSWCGTIFQKVLKILY